MRTLYYNAESFISVGSEVDDDYLISRFNAYCVGYVAAL